MVIFKKKYHTGDWEKLQNILLLEIGAATDGVVVASSIAE